MTHSDHDQHEQHTHTGEHTHSQSTGHTTGQTSGQSTSQGGESENLQLREERLRVETEQQQAGAVRVGKQVTEHEETANVPVREERVVIERTPGSGQPAQGGDLGEGKTIEMPLMKERVNVEKEAVVSEEVNVRKEVTERQQPVQETVRKEELVTDRGAGLVTEGDSGQSSQHSTEQGHSHRG